MAVPSYKLYHSSWTRALRALWALNEMNVPHELISMPFPPRATTKQYLQVNPFGTVPALEINDGSGREPYILSESMAILQYLAERHAPEMLIRPDEPDYHEYLNYLHRSDATFTFPWTIFYRYSRLEPPARRSPQVVDDYAKFATARMKIMESRLEDGREFIAGDRFTVADIGVVYPLTCADTAGVKTVFSPNIERYYLSIIKRPAFQKARLHDWKTHCPADPTWPDAKTTEKYTLYDFPESIA